MTVKVLLAYLCVTLLIISVPEPDPSLLLSKADAVSSSSHVSNFSDGVTSSARVRQNGFLNHKFRLLTEMALFHIVLSSCCWVSRT